MPTSVLAQGMMNWSGSPSGIASDDHTVREETEGKEIWEKLQAKQAGCKNLTDENYETLGEYFMGQAIGNTERHAAMNQMMTSMMGEEGEKRTHLVMGKHEWLRYFSSSSPKWNWFYANDVDDGRRWKSNDGIWWLG